MPESKNIHKFLGILCTRFTNLVTKITVGCFANIIFLGVLENVPIGIELGWLFFTDRFPRNIVFIVSLCGISEGFISYLYKTQYYFSYIIGKVSLGSEFLKDLATMQEVVVSDPLQLYQILTDGVSPQFV